jgi:hypothetical protein
VERGDGIVGAVTDELCEIVGRGKFVGFFEELCGSWRRWSEEYHAPTSVAVLHDMALREMPRSRFLKCNPDLVGLDAQLFAGLRGKRDELLGQDALAFTLVFQRNLKLIEPARRELQQALDAELPLAKLNYLCAAVNSLVFALTLEGHEEIGADEPSANLDRPSIHILPVLVLTLLLLATHPHPSCPYTSTSRCSACPWWRRSSPPPPADGIFSKSLARYDRRLGRIDGAGATEPSLRTVLPPR